MAKKKKNIDRAAEFNNYYKSLFQDRWDDLKVALLKEKENIEFSKNLEKPYFFDEASLFCVNLLDIKEGDNVLDMCAAPGGKSLVLASKLKGTGHLTSNDRSSKRRARLHNVIDSHLKEEYRKNISITGHDSTKWGLFEQEVYDKILLDAPCSSERHVLSDPSYLKQWSLNRPKHLAYQQFAMLAAALEAVKVGGTILYSTCAITPLEDEDVIKKLFKKRKDRFELINFECDIAEDREFGKIVLPDVSKNRGPLYFCLIRRKK
ncbi:MAG: RsmB/NOP family class I SAM-dependent RNA methyltransferase [Sphaerochaetaceae bacterium]|nr:RsmB/NOP family class I SAM-dependent RNA methyltransferase [Sphaerochaetaceae bacterium]